MQYLKYVLVFFTINYCYLAAEDNKKDQQPSTNKTVIIGGGLAAGTLTTFILSKKFEIATACLVIAAWVGAGMYAFSVLKDTFKDVSSFFWPSKEEIEKQICSAYQLKLLQAEISLRNLMVKNIKEEEGELGLPKLCESEAKQLLAIGGHAEFKKIKEDYEFCKGFRRVEPSALMQNNAVERDRNFYD